MVRSSNYRRREPRVNAPFLPRPTGTEANEERRQATLPAMPPGLRSPSAMPDIVLTTLNAKYSHAAFRLPSGERPATKILPAPPPEFSQLVLPYDLYTDEDVAHRVIYVEASRGCPFTCEFCLSSLDIPVRQAPLPELLSHLQRLLDRGVRQFKFVDRTFNLNVSTSRTILEFFLERCQPG